MFKRFERNTAGRDLAIGDIHGNFSAVRALLTHIKFDPAVDRLFVVGDLVDRGPESNAVTDWLAYPWLHSLRGNHEEMAIWWAEGTIPATEYMGNGGGWNINNSPARQMEIVKAFQALPIAMEVETAAGPVGLVHAGCPFPDWALFRGALLGQTNASKMQLDAIVMSAQWSRDRLQNIDHSHTEGVAAVVVGHTPMERMSCLGNTFFIDTGGWLPTERGGQQFTILDLNTLRPLALPSRLRLGS